MHTHNTTTGDIRQAKPLWPHQRDGLAFALENRNSLLDIVMGGAKSRIAVELLKTAGLGKTLIGCPSAALGVWKREFAKWWPDVEPVILKGTLAKNRKAIKQLPSDGFAVVASYGTIRAKIRDELARINWSRVIADESHKLKSHDSKTSNTMYRLGKSADYRMALTGTPCPHSPLDLFGQFRFLDDTVLGDDWDKFAEHFGVPEHWNGSVRYRKLRKDRAPELRDAYRKLAFRVTAAQLDLNLPPVTHHRIDVELTKGKRAYAELEKEVRATFPNGYITPRSDDVRLLRLHQVASGIATTDSGKITQVDDAKQKALLQICEGIASDETAIVFYQFTPQRDQIKQVAKKLKRNYGEISGHRKCLNDRGQLPESLRGSIVAVQIAAGGTGIDLTQSRYAIYLAHTWNAGDHAQSLKRLDRPGQTRPVQIYDIVARDTVDEIVLHSIKRKQRAVAVTLDGPAGNAAINQET